MCAWNIMHADSLTSASLVALLNNEISAICLPDFVSDEVCKQTVKAIYAQGIDYYKDKYPKIGRIGITQSEHKHTLAQKEIYFEKVPAARDVQQALFENSRDLLADVVNVVRGAWGGNAGLAFEESLQQAYFAGLVRVINQARLHYDWAPLYDFGWQTDRISAQLSWNIYLQVGDQGGTTRIYRQFGRKSDLQYVLPGGYFDGKVVADTEYIEIPPERGELVIFNSQNYHEVERTEGETERITLSSFIGWLKETEQLLFWS